MISILQHKLSTVNGNKIAVFEAIPTNEQSTLVVILGNGIGGTMDCSNKEIAQHFASNGIRAIAFDYLFFGESEGEPRQYFDIKSQLRDWDVVVEFAKGRHTFGKSKVVLWGTSFGGSHVLHLAAKRKDIVGVIAQCPNVDFLHTVIRTPILKLIRLIGLGVSDLVSRVFGGPPIIIPLVGEQNSSALMSTADAIEGYPAHAKGSVTWKNQITASFVLSLFAYRPIKLSHRICIPALLCICQNDSIADPNSALEAGKRIQMGKTVTFDCDHFELYEPQFTNAALAHQMSFLQGLISQETKEI